MRDYFEAEMRLLHEAAQDFSRAYPEQAGMLNLQEVKDRDPYVERLLEGMAFLTAQIRQRIDDDVPEVCEALLNQLWPHFLRPVPSLSILQFSPRPGQLQQTRTLAKGSAVLSPPVGEERVICRFRTTSDTLLQPMRLARLSLIEPPGGGTALILGFQLDAGIVAESLELRGIKLYLHADPQVALKLHHALTADVQSVRVSFPDHPGQGARSLGGPETVTAAHLGVEEMLVPGAGRSFVGFHLLQEYFAFREKYQFVNLSGFDLLNWPPHCSAFEVEIRLKGVLDKELKLKKENFLLHCTPAVNLFSATSEPIHLTHLRSEYPVVADAAAAEGMEVYSVDAVSGSDGGSGRRHDYLALHAYKHRGGRGRYFQSSRKENGVRPLISIRVGGDSAFSRESLSCAITACNGDYPRRLLQENTLRVPSPDIPSWVQVVNLTRPSKVLRPPMRRDYRLALISHLSLHYGTLSSVETFRQMLSLYDWSGLEANQRRIEGILGIAVHPVDRISRGALMRGLRVELTLHEENFASQADIHLFGLILHHFLGMYASLNTFVETRILCHPSHRDYAWKPLVGESYRL
ncbi:type VI secretion system protein TssF [Desulfuromonas soudanensis]|uniref:Type VI secretion system protein TssF n=1 Tax=Desulfuromonas soudanensis TaxID=1603606 RepID=A0A0M4D955_9BACT|nr:type VI secretion system baseplate subunit TssF [Desulfuromonas soudanensis]ALC17972.1 type VI secretion system protein TssF [Desulfuromonas soudanensis]